MERAGVTGAQLGLRLSYVAALPLHVPGDWQAPAPAEGAWWCAVCGAYAPVDHDGRCVQVADCLARLVDAGTPLGDGDRVHGTRPNRLGKPR